jgi:predicted nucleic acid-binding protein
VSLYLDASIVVPLFVTEPHTARARTILSTGANLIVSDLTAAEFASAISRLVRMQLMNEDAAGIAFANFDSWIGRAATRIHLAAGDLRSTESMLRTLNIALTTPDAMHVAVALRLRAELATLDGRMAEAATKLGMIVPQL